MSVNREGKSLTPFELDVLALVKKFGDNSRRWPRNEGITADQVKQCGHVLQRVGERLGIKPQDVKTEINSWDTNRWVTERQLTEKQRLRR